MQPKAQLLDGKALSAAVRRRLAERVAKIRANGRSVRLDAILPGSGADTAATVYAENQRRTCAEAGIDYVLHAVAPGTQEQLSATVEQLNEDSAVRAIMMHLPLPEGTDTEALHAMIDPRKDVEGVNPANIGNVVYGRRSLVPCTALAVMELIESTGVKLPGARVVIVGASNIVGKPVAVLLMRAEATVISTNKYTTDLKQLAVTADVLVSAAGVPGLVTADMVKPGAVVVDVGINRVKGADGVSRTVGDVAFESVREVAGWLTPVPGGVGPMTVAMLLRNTVDAAER